MHSRHDCHLLAIRCQWPPRIQLLHRSAICHMWSICSDCNWPLQPHRRRRNGDPTWRGRGPLQPDSDGAPDQGHLVADQPRYDCRVGVHDVEDAYGVVGGGLFDNSCIYFL